MEIKGVKDYLYFCLLAGLFMSVDYSEIKCSLLFIALLKIFCARIGVRLFCCRLALLGEEDKYSN